VTSSSSGAGADLEAGEGGGALEEDQPGAAHAEVQAPGEVLGQKREMRHWLQLGAAADVADAAATVVAWRSLSPSRRVVMPLVAAAVGFVGWTVANTID